ncbi:hypothetical protein G7Z17_g475 [Cylindrodendrum hubeiense]|uniref:Metallo-beta-lactamase domain-containing protein n=1 Tax=Cylindrodendrum hubeiense TaxID=595255 RepID=A0A9P5LG90_9HYPO|nr:hypothetical protein G7Z17_g475 [Cylindrodendrum hubeiense]
MATNYRLDLPHDCPFSARRLTETIFLFRENDGYGQYPNILAKICMSDSFDSRDPATTLAAGVIVLSDAGCATNVKNPYYGTPGNSDMPEKWNLNTVLKYTINPGGQLPYLVITSHCHFDHILGIGLLPPTDSNPKRGDVSERQGPPTTVLSSAFDPDFINPWDHLCMHSMAKTFKAVCPYYTIGVLAEDSQHILYNSPSVSRPISTGIIVLQTPGHTPDSLSWYDTASHLLSVGDSFYEVSSPDTRTSKWGADIRSPIIFETHSDLALWWKSVDRVLQFVREQNGQLIRQYTGAQQAPRVAIGAGHVTALSPDAESFILSIRAFMSRILRDEVPTEKIDVDWLASLDLWGWDDGERAATIEYEWIVWSPKRIIEEGRQTIPRIEWS